MIAEEMYRQGDLERERGLELSPLTDRAKKDGLAKSQAGFLSFLVCISVQ